MQIIEQFLNYLIADKGYSDATYEVYRTTLMELRKFFLSKDEALTWQTIDKDILRAWVAHCIEKGNAPRSVSKKMSAVRSLYKYMLRMNIVASDPTRGIQNPKIPKRLPTFVKESEMDHLLDDIEFGEDYEGVRNKLILLTFYCTGIRISELLGLCVKDVNLSNNELKVLGKRNKERIVPFVQELTNAFNAFFQLRKNIESIEGLHGKVFLRLDGTPMNAPEVRAIVKNYLSMVTNQKKRTPHVLRHTYATVMLNNGADLEAVKNLLGHNQISTTEVYTHTTFTELKKEYDKAHPRA
ncbi:MAG: tyrosine-type recombinase/integrase [Bacteroidaceae bacterium]|jgi:integrase/recombinase XerC|nr:tyrosine-type recombinase/integrase [Bacteroidaceae bacterium]